MSLIDYEESKRISANDPGFTALLFSLMRKADTPNTAKIKQMWPREWHEMQERYDAPGGALTLDEINWLRRRDLEHVAREEGT